ncbi:hypothetical protein [Sphingomonas sp.]|uniref:hypothetical protein n=1 Tax=Sphingomonas sp. TaxID=28214 RepID=UPI0035BBA4FD
MHELQSSLRATMLRTSVTSCIYVRAGYFSGIGEPTMRMFETVTSSMLAIAVQALVVGVVITTF